MRLAGLSAASSGSARGLNVTGEKRIGSSVGDVHASEPAASQQSSEMQQSAHRSPLDPARILTSIGEVPYEWDIASDALFWAANVGSVLKVKDVASIATGRGYARLLDADNAEQRFDAVVGSQERDHGKGVAYSVEYSLRFGDQAGEKIWVEDTGRWFGGLGGRPVFAHGVVRVISERRARDDRLAYLSRFDALTGEMNRGHLTEVLEENLALAKREGTPCGFLLISIDKLSRVNNAYGFDVADEVISAVARRIRSCMRVGDCLGRFSGNKFGVILKNCPPEDMESAADRLLSGVREDVIQTTAGPIAVTVTIGGGAAPRHARTVAEMIARAEEAMFTARAKRLGSFQAYRPSVEREAMRRENIRATDEIVTALNERRMLIAFEPVVKTATRALSFYEALVRIRGVDSGLVSAHAIITTAERLGLVRLIDYRVLELVIEQLVAAPDLKLSLNVSPSSTIDPDWWASLGAQLRSHAGIAERLTIEITEMAAIQDVDDTRGFVTRVKDLGCRIAIDDFGAGNTSFRNLRKLGVDMVKIDGSFVQNLVHSTDDRVFVRALLQLAQGLGLLTVAEWVQDETAAAMLADWGCDYLQGEFIGPASLECPDACARQIPPSIASA
jgi:diguanylate cyclase (GGDEF)-like protein